MTRWHPLLSPADPIRRSPREPRTRGGARAPLDMALADRRQLPRADSAMGRRPRRQPSPHHPIPWLICLGGREARPGATRPGARA
eukprot:CAMPEP_0206023718 /NCGR_PEP_ID=MMETSP1464-20131121/36946_1 /ASSEMBLY_ACC=CAM_ASM_001124 /TAXON_ID=119497 /ORGANISM="Exanthemachrysis gayraliae, Strain RCC1523" /LENGTH=84 /DNA_ID=CAMNT_0053397713 /DNA_START=200 /DNA_END=452 /DNA_ORIENTATION=+